jgi:hypothetical protein
MKIAIVIPIYKKKVDLSSEEKSLITQLKKVFEKRHIILIVPKSIECDWIDNDNFSIISFKNYYFTDKNSYSELLCSLFFYNCFRDFDYIQIVQTDCWVFEDRLDYFISKGFDYIGAPWMVGGFEGKPQNKLWKVGNGGFSLRKVKTFSSILRQISCTRKGLLPIFKNRHLGLFKLLKNAGFRNNLRHYLKKTPGEDIFWCIYVPHVFNNVEFKIADLCTASHYSFEVNPEYLYKQITHLQLPMGCHNWANNNSKFWLKHFNPSIR